MGSTNQAQGGNGADDERGTRTCIGTSDFSRHERTELTHLPAQVKRRKKKSPPNHLIPRSCRREKRVREMNMAKKPVARSPEVARREKEGTEAIRSFVSKFKETVGKRTNAAAA